MARYSQPSRRVEFLTLMLCVSISLVLLFLPDDVQISVATRFSVVITEPYQRVVNFAEDLFRLRRENGDLLAQVTELELQLLAVEHTASTDSTVQAASGSTDTFAGRLIPCEVVARKRSRYALMIKIRSETDVAWQLYQPVMSPRGLLGRVRKVVSPQLAWVELISAPDVAIGCELVRTGLLGILRSSVDQFILDMVGRDEDVREGDLIITSGVAEVRELGEEDTGLGLMPRGLPVGVVQEVSSPLDELFKKITVQPHASFNYNEWVFVVQDGPPGGARRKSRP